MKPRPQFPLHAVAMALAPSPSSSTVGDAPMPIAELAMQLRTLRPLEADRAAAVFATLQGAHDSTVAREIALSLSSLDARERNAACTVAATLVQDDVRRQSIGAGLARVRADLHRALGAEVPFSVVIDATLLEAVRAIAACWAPEDPTTHREGSEALLRSIAARIGCAIVSGSAVEDAATSAARLSELDPTDKLREQRRAAIADKLRRSLPAP